MLWTFISLFNLKLENVTNIITSINNIAIHKSKAYNGNVQLIIIQIDVTII